MRNLLFRRTYFNALKKMNPEHRLEAYDAIMAYAFEEDETEVSDAVAPVMEMILDNIGNDFRRYEAAREAYKR